MKSIEENVVIAMDCSDKDLSGYDVVILGAIGSVFGDYHSTLSILAKCLNENGIVIIDDAYINDNSDFIYPLMFKKRDILKQIEKAGMELVENDILENKVIGTALVIKGIFKKVKNHAQRTWLWVNP